MQCSLLFLCTSFIPAAWSALGYTQQNGRTRLIGSSFGVLGIDATFDYVIVGGGTAGLTVANRLAANPALSVAVIEGGSFYEIDNGNKSQIPAFDVLYSSASPSSIQPLVDWGIVTVPQAQLAGRSIHYTQGKCLGGSSARNYMAYQRGTSGSYQKWAGQVGDQSYTFANILPYFERSPQFTPPNYSKRGPGSQVTYDSTAFNARGGPLQVSYSNFYDPFSAFVKKAFLSLGLPNIAGLNSGKLLGFSEFTSTVDPQAGTRSSSETSFLQESLSSSSLQVYQKTLAQKILFDGKKTATGVKVVTAGTAYTLSARKEVILAAGVFRSPQLLMVSGIGPTEVLKSLSIPIISKSVGVGQGMWDQPNYSISYKVNVTTNSQLLVNPQYLYQATEDYLTSQTGPLATAGGNWVGWEKLPVSLRSGLGNSTLSDLGRFPADWPELELLLLPAATVAVNDTDNYISISIATLTTTSRGNMTINSTDTDDNPLVSPNWLLTTTDQELAVQGFKRAREIAKATGITIGPEISPGIETQTDTQILEYIKQTLAPIHHASATCSMGGSKDPAAVVDTKGRVHGVQSLRIIDASIFPLLPPGHPQATVYMLAEKLADEILHGN